MDTTELSIVPDTVANKLPVTEKQPKTLKRLIYDIIFLVGFLACLPVGAFPQANTVCSFVMLACIAACFLDDNFYLFCALFMFMRYKMLIGDTPVFRVYSYLVVIKFIIDLPRTKFRLAYLPALFVFALHCLFAFGRIEGSLRLALNTLVDALIIYVVLLKVLTDKNLLRRFFTAFLLGGVFSGVYGWTNSEMTVDINVRGAGNETVARNFGSLGDPNFAGLFYNTCMFSALLLNNLPKWLKAVFTALFMVLLLQTASLSGILTMVILACIVIILKFRAKSFFILLFTFVGAVVILSILLAIPQFREIPAISGLIIRATEKLNYIAMGRLDLLTTDRSAIWQEAMSIFTGKGIFGKLFGGSVITVMYIDTSLISIAIHQSLLQGLLNFGIIGTLLIYLPLAGIICYRALKHFTTPAGYADEDIAILRLLLPLCFLIFGMSVDFFIDWTYLFYYFI